MLRFFAHAFRTGWILWCRCIYGALVCSIFIYDARFVKLCRRWDGGCAALVFINAQGFTIRKCVSGDGGSVYIMMWLGVCFVAHGKSADLRRSNNNGITKGRNGLT